jgi:DNA-binding NarL/FixJ family response regulator
MFSKNEIDAIFGVSRGWSNTEMAAQLGWSEQQVAKCVDQVLAKLKLSFRVELVFYACTEEGKAVLRRSAA